MSKKKANQQQQQQPCQAKENRDGVRTSTAVGRQSSRHKLKAARLNKSNTSGTYC